MIDAIDISVVDKAFVGFIAFVSIVFAALMALLLEEMARWL